MIWGYCPEQPRSVQTADGGHALVAPRALLHVLLQERLDLPEEPDLVVLRVSCEGSDGDRPVRRTLEILDRADPLTGFRAMERMTAFPAAIICAHLASAEAPRGAQPLERVIDPALFLERFRQRGLVLTETLRRPLAT
ncbi:MAG: hypothetical protein KatS3mg102_1601 [Planctomycetota bacterium]|nr:MAG: hypothetical protein KatS3mg102_1601 [Planctomycetota bacterium]